MSAELLIPLSRILSPEMFSGFVKTASHIDFDNREQVNSFNKVVNGFLDLVTSLLASGVKAQSDEITAKVGALVKHIKACRPLLAKVRANLYECQNNITVTKTPPSLAV